MPRIPCPCGSEKCENYIEVGDGMMYAKGPTGREIQAVYLSADSIVAIIAALRDELMGMAGITVIVKQPEPVDHATPPSNPEGT